MKIYVRGRQKVGAQVKQPRYRVVAVTGEAAGKMKVEATHFRKTELEQIATDTGAQIVYLEAMEEEKRGTMKK